MITSIVIGVILLGVIAFCVGLYNSLVQKRNEFKNAFSQIDVQLQRRYELIPNLVETARAYMEHESETLTRVTEARNTAAKNCEAAAKNPADSSLMSALGKAEGKLASAMSGFNMVMENYPDLKADQNMRELSDEITSTENRVGFARQAFSDAVMRYNNACQEFPSNVVAGVFNFNTAEPFEIENEEMRKAVNVSFQKAA